MIIPAVYTENVWWIQVHVVVVDTPEIWKRKPEILQNSHMLHYLKLCYKNPKLYLLYERGENEGG